jgi:CO/xanthine dehydrogenase Mo-binding subunit
MRKFIQDIVPKRALPAMVYRSPFRKGEITNLRLPNLPRGYFCVTPRDIPGNPMISCYGYTLPVLSESEVRYLGEPLLLFCGPNAEVLSSLGAEVELSYKEEDPLVYKDLSGPYQEAQIVNYAHGDVDLAFSLAEQIVEGEYQTERQQHCYPDTQGALADWDGKTLCVNVATQDPFGLRTVLSDCLALPPRKVRVVAVPIGNSMEGKLLSSALVAVQAALLSYAAEKPVVLIYDREEDLRFSAKGPGFYIRHQTALDQDGGTLAVRVQIFMDGGCYPPKDCDALRQAVHSAWGAYKVANLEVIGKTLKTDFPPIGPFRAAGRAQALFAAELHSSRLEEIAQLDPYNWKKQNLTERAYQNNEQSTPAIAVLDAVTEMADFTRKYSAYSAVKKRRKTIDQGSYPLRGIGLSLAYQDGEGSWSAGSEGGWAMKLGLDRNRRVRIHTSLVDCAMGIHEMLIHRTAENLAIQSDRITLQNVDTQDVPDTGPTTLNRAVSVGIPLLDQCCQTLIRKRKQGAPPLEVRNTFRPDRLASSVAGSAVKQWNREGAWAATVVELELDSVTFHGTCRGIWMVIWTGTVWSQSAVLELLEGETLRALGTTSLPGYSVQLGSDDIGCSGSDLIMAAGVPGRIQIQLLDTDTEEMRGFEKLPHLGVPAAYAAAVCQATGLYIDKIPITSEVVQQCLEI